MEVKFERTKNYAPDYTVTDDAEQLILTYDMSFDGADFSKEFEASEQLKDYEREEAFGEWQNEFEKVTLYKILKDKVGEFLKVDEIPGYVAHEVEVSLYGEDASNQKGSVEVKVWVDLETGKINDAVNLFFESTRK